MGPFGRRPRAQEPIEEATPAEGAPSEPVLELVAPPPPAPQVRVAASSEYRRVGDDLALLTVEVAAATATAAALRLIAPRPADVEHPEPTSITLLPGIGLARLTFVVHRHLPARAGDSLELTAGPDLRFTVPPPVQRPAIGSPDTEADVAAAAVASLAGEELFGLIAMLEKRCSVAERVAADLRAGPTESVRLAQAYREIWDVRALLDSREEAHRRSADLVEAAEAALREQESLAAAAQATLSAESDELNRELDEARAAVEQLGTELERTRAAVAEWSAEAERARANLADAVTRAGEIETERDEALAMALEYETAATDASAGVDSLMRQIEDARRAAEEAESRLESERTLYEARIVAGVEAERKRSVEVEELKARLGERRTARSAALRREPQAIADSFVQAQRERLKHTSLDDQRAEVAALERQLERLKAR